MKKYNRKKSNKKYFRGTINFSDKRDPKIDCDNINHIIKLKDSIINFLHGDLVEFEILSSKSKIFIYLNNSYIFIFFSFY